MSLDYDIDVRDKQEVRMLDRCPCGEEYISHLQLRHTCEPCVQEIIEQASLVNAIKRAWRWLREPHP